MTVSINKRLIDMKVLERFAPLMRNVAHPLRLRILDYLRCEGEPRCVNSIAEATEASQAFVSQQLRILKDMGALSCRRQGNHILYDIANPEFTHLLDCIRRQ